MFKFTYDHYFHKMINKLRDHKNFVVKKTKNHATIILSKNFCAEMEICPRCFGFRACGCGGSSSGIKRQEGWHSTAATAQSWRASLAPSGRRASLLPSGRAGLRRGEGSPAAASPRREASRHGRSSLARGERGLTAWPISSLARGERGLATLPCEASLGAANPARGTNRAAARAV